MANFKRRDFIRLSSFAALPLVGPLITGLAPQKQKSILSSKDSEAVYFINDGIFYKPTDFLDQLQEINRQSTIERDSYGEGATMEKLLQKFIEITGKEAAVYLPSGTLANQLALSQLCRANTKVCVQETSHVYRDEGDAAQTLFNKRLIPLAAGKHYFTLEELQKSIQYHQEAEAFAAGVGAISIETPVRRCDGQAFPLAEIKKISAWCKQQGYKLHLDGARLHMAAAFTDTSIKAYAECFDSVYMCLYKYLGATGGAVLCGDKAFIDQMHHLIKIHGGCIFTNWTNAAMALYHLNTIDEVMDQIKAKSKAFFMLMAKLKGIEILPLVDGTNLFNVKLGKGIDPQKLNARLRAQHNIIFGQPKADGFVKIKVNPTLLRRDNQQIYDSFKEAIAFAKV